MQWPWEPLAQSVGYFEYGGINLVSWCRSQYETEERMQVL